MYKPLTSDGAVAFVLADLVMTRQIQLVFVLGATDRRFSSAILAAQE
jgi:hypothetical protein